MHAVPISLDDAARRLAKLDDPRYDASGGLSSMRDGLGNGLAYVLVIDGREAAIFAVDYVSHDKGRELIITAALQLESGFDLVRTVLPAIEVIFGRGCAAVSVATKRRGLVRLMADQGYEKSFVMRKKLK